MNDLASVPLGNFGGIGPLGNTAGIDNSGLGAFNRFTGILSLTIGLLTIVGGIWFTFQIITGALGWLGAGGDKAAVETARKRILNAVMGLIIVVFSYALIALVGTVLGFPNIFNPYVALNL